MICSRAEKQDVLADVVCSKAVYRWQVKKKLWEVTVDGRLRKGHNSIVSCLVVANGFLYSGSWDGTVRLWFLSHHSALLVLEDDATSTGLFVPVLSLSVHHKFIVSSYENGNIKIWKNDNSVKSKRVQDGAVFALHMDMNLIFTGGSNKSISIQGSLEDELEIMLTPIASINCDSPVTSLVSRHGTLYVGLSNKEIRAYRT